MRDRRTVSIGRALRRRSADLRRAAARRVDDAVVWAHRVLAVLIGYAGLVALVAATRNGSTGLAAPFAAAGAALLATGVLVATRRLQSARWILAGLAAAAFALALVDIGRSSPLDPDPYRPLWVPSALAAALIGVRGLEWATPVWSRQSRRRISGRRERHNGRHRR